MSIFEYNEELHNETLRQEGYEDGLEDGLKEGIKAFLITCKEIGLSKEDMQSKLEIRYHMSKEHADEYIKRYWNC